MTRAHDDGRRKMLGVLTGWLRHCMTRTTAMGENDAVDCPRQDDINTAMNDDHVWDLIARHWAEQLGPGEAAALQAWAAESPEREAVLCGAGRILDLSRDLREADETELAWARVRGRLHDERLSKRGSRFSHPALGRSRGVAMGARVSSRRVRAAAWMSIAAALVVTAGIVTRRWHTGALTASSPREWATHAGERVTVELGDGSRVMLGPDTKLRVASADFKRERTLRLQGIAHFAVAHDPSHPFTVLAGESSAQAVGTAFAVRAYPEDGAVQVVVTEGRVLLRSSRSQTTKSAMLEPGDAGRVSAVGAMSVERGADLDESLGWMRGRLRYRMTSAADVARDLQRWYGVTIILDDSARATIHITTSFDPAWTAADAVQRFAELLNVTVNPIGNAMHLSRRTRVAAGTVSSDSTSRTAEIHP